MIETILSSEVVIATTSVAGGFIVRMLFDRRKLSAENKGAELDADTKAVELYERYAQRVENQITALQNRQNELETQVSELRFENQNLKLENAQLKSENSILHKEIQGFNSQIEELKQQIAKKSKP